MAGQLNTSASTDARHSRTGKDAMLYNENGEPFAQVNSFEINTGFNNTKYAPLGNNLELEATGTVGISISIEEIVVKDGELFNRVLDSIESGECDPMTFDGVIQGRNGSQERVTYRECIFSGDQNIQRAKTGDTLSRGYKLHSNSKPERRSQLTI